MVTHRQGLLSTEKTKIRICGETVSKSSWYNSHTVSQLIHWLQVFLK